MKLLNGFSLVMVTAAVGFVLPSNADEPVDLVYPQLDSANSRWFFFDSASRPFGMVNLSPDTELGGAWGSGYRYHSKEIKGFSMCTPGSYPLCPSCRGDTGLFDAFGNKTKE